ncbi:HpcH/HpaI aldolase/citrate lyase family protein [Exiguobacterium himgiriensis]|nr:aldolase/citrate lyase family protein [Exiguobacterium sp. s122]MCT4781651.1 HpcH/HpaI aldolase/citrate lyase family protein [Exiguobacterium himgiriensis]
MYITNQPKIAVLAEQQGVDWIFVDLELLGKVERQGHLDTVISRHAREDVSLVRAALQSASLLVRVNPIHEMSREEIDDVIQRGADIIMLPYYKTVKEVETFLQIVAGRVKVCLLCETKEAVACMPDVLGLSEIHYIHIGLNDLHLSYGQTFLFEPLADGLIEQITSMIARTPIEFGFGGIGRIGEGNVPAERILGEHVRLGSTLAILSRSFCHIGAHRTVSETEAQLFQEGVWRIRAYEQQLAVATADWLEQNRLQLVADVQTVVTNLQAGKGMLS